MTDTLAEGSGLLIGAGALVSVALYLWYLAALSQLFPKLGLPAAQGWVPVLNEWKLLGQGGLPGWLVLLIFVPPLGLVLLVARTIAMYRIGRRIEAPGWLTVVGFLLPPLWATLTVARFDDAYAPQGAAASLQYDVAAGQPAGPIGAQHATVSHAPTPNLADKDFADLLRGLQENSARARVQAEAKAAPGLAPAPQLYDTEAHMLPPITPEALAAATGAVVPPLAAQSAYATPAADEADAVSAAGSPEAEALGAPIEAEYERLAREAFLSPPATAFGDTVPQQRFSWDAAVSQPAPPAASPTPPQAETLVPQRQPVTQAIPLTPPPAQPASVDLPPMHPASFSGSEPTETEVIAIVEPPSPALLDAGDTPQLDFAPQSTQYAETEASGARETFETFEMFPAIPKPEAVARPVAPEVEFAPFAADPNDVTATYAPVTDFNWVLEFDSGVVVQLHPDTIIGRAPQGEGTAVAVAISDVTRTLSKTHARFTHVGRLWLVEDLGSTNGVRIVQPDGTETMLIPHEPARATTHVWLGTLRATLRAGRS